MLTVFAVNALPLQRESNKSFFSGWCLYDVTWLILLKEKRGGESMAEVGHYWHLSAAFPQSSRKEEKCLSCTSLII